MEEAGEGWERKEEVSGDHGGRAPWGSGQEGRCPHAENPSLSGDRLGLAGKHRQEGAPKEKPVLKLPWNSDRKGTGASGRGEPMSQPCAGRPLGQRGLEKSVAGCAAGTEDQGFGGAALQAWLASQEGCGVPQGLGRVCGSGRHGQIWLSQLTPATGWGTHTGHARAERGARWPRGGHAALEVLQVSSGVRGLGRAGDGLQVPGGAGGAAGGERGTQAWRLEAPWRPRGDGVGAAGERGPLPARAIGLEPAPGGTGPNRPVPGDRGQ